MFEKTLTDVVKGIRASKRDTALYISQCIAEIKTEINSSDMHVKANAIQKLTFLQMMGYSMSWASFASIEVMSSPRFAHKRIGYLAAVCFCCAVFGKKSHFFVHSDSRLFFFVRVCILISLEPRIQSGY